MKLVEFLDEKPLYYDDIDYNRMPLAYESIKTLYKLPKIIHIVGTNGKGTTGRFLAQMLFEQGLHVGHYTSPHILNFNERVWIDGFDVDDVSLELAHQKLQNALSPIFLQTLSYFEYTTLLSMLIFCQKCDYVVLEAGLGGEWDATNVFEKILSVVTPIGYDHQDFLGNTIASIATTKINSVKSDFVLAKQCEQEVYDIAQKKAYELGKCVILAENFLDKNDCLVIDEIVRRCGYASFLKDNLTTALCAFRKLGFKDSIRFLRALEIKGRCQTIAPNVTLDVGHNPMSAYAIAKHFEGKKVILVYNSFKDKDYAKILSILKPIVKEVQIISIVGKRVAQQEDIIAVLKLLGMNYCLFSKIEKKETYLVFGSFAVAEAFLKDGFEK
ncbi:MAG: Mur ligase family protein [Sulfurospirillaceae bacterium]|nr:Mur ligase family protein [Sulfurospirillaceae bacterium]